MENINIFSIFMVIYTLTVNVIYQVMGKTFQVIGITGSEARMQEKTSRGVAEWRRKQ